MFSYFEQNFIEKFPWESGFSNFSQIEMTRNNAILKRYNIFIFFFRIVIFYSPYIYCANFIAKFGWESGFLRLGP